MSRTRTRPEDLQAVIFDLDGTLADTLPVVVKAFKLTFEEFALPVPTQNEIFAHFGPTEDGVIGAMFGEVSASAVTVFYDRYQRLLSGGIAPFSGIRSLLNECRAAGHRLAVVTGKSERGAAITLEALDLADAFEFVRGGSAAEIVKAAAIVDLVQGWQLNPDHVVYVGDHAMDVAEARKAGVVAVSAAWASTVDRRAITSAGPDELFSTVEEFAKWLRVPIPTRGPAW